MGVTGLWSILSPVKQHKPLSSLRGQTLAVDLSIWVCENQGVRQMQNRVLRPHLRNLFFRISTLLQLGIRPVFVIEGEAPALKHEEMERRLQARHKGVTSVNSKRKFGRGRLQGLLKECCELLDALGVPYIQSQGEAESTCAALNAAGLVDACVSDDGDCFLYGARVVYRNLTIDAKDPHVESFSMEDVTSDLSLTREGLVALALLLGCDYCPAGVPGVGQTWAVKLMESLADVDVLKRFRQWKSMAAPDCVDSTEVYVWRRATAMASFPPLKVIEEFLKPKDSMLAALPQWNRPCIVKMMRLGACYLEWPEDYSLEKTLPLTTLWDQLHLLLLHGASCEPGVCLKPCRIIKRRVKQGMPCFEVEWENNIQGAVDESGHPRRLVTVEQEERFQACFPALVLAFHQSKAEKPKRSRKTKAQENVDTLSSQPKDVDTLSGQFDSLTIDSQHGRPVDCSAQAASSQSRPQAHVHKRPPALLDGDSALSTDAVDWRVVNRREGQTSGRCASGRGGERTSSSSLIDRSVEYVPLSQRLDVLLVVEGEDNSRSREDAEVVDLDRSYTYIPLSQRLKARLDSRQPQQESASSSSSSASTSATGLVLCAQNSVNSRPALDRSPSYVPLSQRLKHSLDSLSGVDVGTLSPEASSEALGASSSLRTSASEFEGTFLTKSGTDFSVCRQQTSCQSVTRVREGGGGRQSGAPNAETEAVVDVHAHCASRTCMSGHKARQSAHPVQESVSDSVPALQEFPSHPIKDRAPDSDDSGAAILSSQNNTGPGLPASRSAEGQNQNDQKMDSAASSKRCEKKKTVVSQRGRKAKTCSQRVKTISISDLLEDWSDTEAIATHCQNSESDIAISSDESEKEMNIPFPESQGGRLPGSGQPEIKQALVRSRFSPVDRQLGSSPSGLTTGQSHVVPPASTPCHTGVAETQELTSAGHLTPSLEGDSVVSDGHFTLHHTLFTSMEGSEVGSPSPGAEGRRSPFSCHGRHGMNTSAFSPQAEDEGQQATHFLLTQSPSLDELKRNIALHTEVVLTESLSWSETSERKRNIPHHSEVILTESLPSDKTSKVKSKVQHKLGEPSRSENRCVLPDQSGVSPSKPASSCSITTAEENGPEDGGIRPADPVSSVAQLPKDGEEARQGEGVGDDGCCFLSLSQRLRLKKSNVKALNAMSNMS